MRVAVVGVGHLGKSHARILSKMPGVELVAVADPDPVARRRVADDLGVEAVADGRTLAGRIDAATVACSTTAHYEVAEYLLRNFVHVMVEKPIAATVEQARELVRLADKYEVALGVGHVERFNPAFEALRRRNLTPRVIRAERSGPFSGRSADVSVVSDLMIHDIDLVLALTSAELVRVEASGASGVTGRIDAAQARLIFADGAQADLYASRSAFEPCRRLRVWGPEGHAEVDCMAKKLRLSQPARPGPGAETVEFDCPNRTDQLTAELSDFVEAARTGRSPRVDGRAGLRALEVAAWIDEVLGMQASIRPAGLLIGAEELRPALKAA